MTCESCSKAAIRCWRVFSGRLKTRAQKETAFRRCHATCIVPVMERDKSGLRIETHFSGLNGHPGRVPARSAEDIGTMCD